MDWSSTSVGGQAAIGLETLADTIEHHDGIVQRIADHRQNGRDHRQIELGLGHGENADHQDRVVQHREDGAERQSPGMKAERDVDEDQQQGEAQRPDGAGVQLVTDLRTDDLELRHLRGRVDRRDDRLDLGADRGDRLARLGRAGG